MYFVHRIAVYTVLRMCICVSVHRGIGEVVFPRRVVFTGRLFHNSTIVRRHLSQSQLAWSAYITLYIKYINISVAVHTF